MPQNKREDAHALWLEDRERPALRAEPLPEAGSDEAVIRATHGAISRGTERLVARGAVPESEHERMRAPLQRGDFPFPVKYGYAVAGHVEDGPAGWIGRRVFCLHPHQDRFVAPLSMLQPIPEAVPNARAVLGANMETAVNAVWDGAVGPGDRVAVIGGGVLGLLAAFICRSIAGTDVSLVDIDPARRSVAEALGLAFAQPDDAPGECDVVIHTSASEAGLETALRIAGFEARIVEASWHGDKAVSVPLGEAFHARRLQIVSSQVGHLPASKQARWTHGRRMQLALSLLADRRLDALFSGETAFAALASSYLDILDDPSTLCHRIRYDH